MTIRTVTAQDQRYMDTALALAYGALGKTAPNPAVGCVIVKHGSIIGAAATAMGGRPHAEPQALEQAGADAQDASVYVTLEPCAHYGRTPPCAEALVKAQPAEVIIACRDPFEAVAGKGIEILQAAGISVIENIRRAQAEQMNAGFFNRLETGRPLVFDDQRPALFDADLSLRPGETENDALTRLGVDGLTRVRRVRPSS